MREGTPGGQEPPRLLDAGAAVIILVGLVLQWAVWPYPEVEARVPASIARVLLSVDKEGLHPMRLLSILALTWVVVRFVPRDAAWLRRPWLQPVIICGQHSLPVFCAGIVLSFLGRLAMEEQSGWAAVAAINLAGTLALAGVGALAAWYRQKGRPAAPRADLPEPAHAGNAGVT